MRRAELHRGDRPNRELHTGEAAFGKFNTALWLAEFCPVISILLPTIERELADMLGPEEVGSADSTRSQRNVTLLNSTRSTSPSTSSQTMGTTEITMTFLALRRPN
jgi:hypothetical protein